MKEKPRTKAFDIGCAIGRSTFELARGFDEVIGVDFSARFIQEAEALKQNRVLRYTMPTEGMLESFHEVTLSELNLEKSCDKVSFWQADACNLKPIFKDFDLILFPNRGHGFGNEPYMMRRRWDYFVRHLLGVEPPKEYKFKTDTKRR